VTTTYSGSDAVPETTRAPSPPRLCPTPTAVRSFSTPHGRALSSNVVQKCALSRPFTGPRMTRSGRHESLTARQCRPTLGASLGVSHAPAPLATGLLRVPAQESRDFDAPLPSPSNVRHRLPDTAGHRQGEGWPRLARLAASIVAWCAGHRGPVDPGGGWRVPGDRAWLCDVPPRRLSIFLGSPSDF
jgi:hypothetical protein